MNGAVPRTPPQLGPPVASVGLPKVHDPAPGVSTPPQEGMASRWARRALSLSVLLLAWAVLVLAMPLWALLAGAMDGLSGRRAARLRFLLVLMIYLSCELVGVIGSLLLWLVTGLGSARGTLVRGSYALQRWWVRTIFDLSGKVLGVRLKVEGLEHARGGPQLVLLRHASLVDTLLPARLLTDQLGTQLRYVLKRDLLWDPCLDIVGQRLPNAFVRRGGMDTEGDLQAVRALTQDIGAQEGLALFPEGTRYSAALRERVLAKLRAADDARDFERAQSLQHVLPPKPGGVLTVLEAAPHLDVVFCAHRGFAQVRSFADIAQGGLVGQEVYVEFWRCAAKSIPKGTEERKAWLHAQWQRVDRVVAQGQP